MDAGSPLAYSIVDVCKSLLDNADVVLDMAKFPDVAILRFRVWGTVAGIYVRVLFRCERIARFDCQVPPSWGPESSYLVLETDVVQRRKNKLRERVDGVMDYEGMADELWQVRIVAGDIMLEIICEVFSWEVVEVSSEEHNAPMN